ncbi:HAD family hydrolase [Streptomonospora litoralis]|uniref:5'-nucleotidase n=1 Tax=Streptomonospora litoralis TaxID=2498135 RepID=A0A4P6Q4F3_9ACTN|nr:HAD family hydrolase [Streptomonospora litoralis]QBI53704.1 5'-nucleotidase [Streptomonospora litoralis]
MVDNGFAHLSGVTHIVWDWNGTLLDDNHANMAALNRVCAEFGREPVDIDYWRGFFRRPLLGCYEDLLGRSLAEDEWARLNRVYDDRYRTELPSCTLADGVPGILADWLARGGSQSLLSMASHESLVGLVAEHSLDDHFARVDGRRFDTPDGSKSRHLAAHLAELDVDPAAVVLIGDIDDDGRAASEAGAHALLVASGMMSRERLKATGHPVLDTPRQAVAALCA